MWGEGGNCGVSANEYSSLWRSNFIFNLWLELQKGSYTVELMYFRDVTKSRNHLPDMVIKEHTSANSVGRWG
jgi:hypothetical protein